MYNYMVMKQKHTDRARRERDEKCELATLKSQTQTRGKSKIKLGYRDTTKPTLGPLIFPWIQRHHHEEIKTQLDTTLHGQSRDS